MATARQIETSSAEEGRGQIEALERLVAQLQHALESRIVIEQAKGVLSERHGLSPEEAFELLRRSARNEQRNIHHVAAEVVASACPNGSGVPG